MGRRNVAVIMSVYKSDVLEALKGAVCSILDQTYPCDLFIYRDGFVDVEMQSYIDQISKHDSVNIISGATNLGLATGLNKLIDTVMLGSYEFVARMDSDDFSLATRIEKQVNYLKNNLEIDVCGTSCKEFGASYGLEEKHLPQTHTELLSFSITRCPFIHPSVMFRATVFKDGNRYPTDTAFTEDMALWFELLSKGYRFGNLNEVLINYCLNEDTVTRRMGMKKAWSEVRIRIKYMFILEKVTLKNTLLILSRILFHLLPASLAKLAYKKAR